MAEVSADGAFGDGFAKGVEDAWLEFVDRVEPLRPDLFRFCLRLTRNPFDAEDLVHDGMLRAFGSLGGANGEIRSPKSFLFRILTNLWIDELRRSRPETRELSGEEVAAMPGPDPAEVRHAAGVALELPPRERAAVVLKESFDLSHAQIAEMLSTTPGAVKVALHRGRKRLETIDTAGHAPRISAELLDRFVEAIRGHDLDAVRAVVIDELEGEVFPHGVSVGADHHAERGWLHGTFYHHIPQREARREGYPLRLEARVVAGERVVLVFRDYADGAGEALEEVWLIEESDGRVSRVRDYCFSPDLVRWVAEREGLPFRPVAYRFRPGVYRDPVYDRPE